MTVLQRPDTTEGEEHAQAPSTPDPGLTVRRLLKLATAAFAGAVCVLLGAIAIAVPTVITWLAEERSTASFWQSIGAAIDLWALAHRAQVHVPGADVVLAPLLLTALMVGICWYAASQVVVDRDELVARVPVIGGWRSAWRALGGPDAAAFIFGYLVAGMLLAHTASFGLAPVRLVSLVPGAVLVPSVGIVLVWWSLHRKDEHPAVDAGLRWAKAHTPVLVSRGIPAALQVLVGLSAACFLLVFGLLLIRGERVLSLYATLDAGIVGTTVLTGTQLLALPNYLVWALSWLTGAGLSVGTVHIGWTGSTAGDLPLLPVLGALPEPGAMPTGLFGLALVPVLAGCWLGYQAVGSTSRLSNWWTKAKVALFATVVVGLAALLLGWLATGGLTPGLLGTIGVNPWLMAGLLSLEVGGGALLTVSVLHLRGARVGFGGRAATLRGHQD